MYRAITSDGLHTLGWKRLEDALIDAFLISAGYPTLIVKVVHRDGTIAAIYKNGYPQ